MRAIRSLAFAAATFALATPAAAAIIIDTGPGVLQPDENLLFNNNPTPAFTIEGITNQSGTVVVATGGEILAPGGGQARLDTQDRVLSSLFTFNGFTNQLIGFDLFDVGLGFTSTELRLVGGTSTEATLTVVDTAGEVFQQTFSIPPNGFFNVLAIDNQLIDYFSVATNGTLSEIRAIRIGGIQPLAIVPEPTAWAMMIVGFGGVGALMRRRRSALAFA